MVQRCLHAAQRLLSTRFRLVALPDTIAEAVNPFEFKPDEMRGLFEVGRQVGSDAFY